MRSPKGKETKSLRGLSRQYSARRVGEPRMYLRVLEVVESFRLPRSDDGTLGGKSSEPQSFRGGV